MAEPNEPFALTKWYFDCVAESGVVAIGYWASLSWHRLSLVWQGLTLYEPGRDPVERTTLRGHAAPARDSDRIIWSAPALDAVLTAETRQPQYATRLLEGPSGYVDWHCEASIARVALDLAGRPVQGSGYVERLTLTIPPWHLPFKELRWGRWIDDGAGRSLVWIDWRGDEPRRWAFIDGVDTRHAAVGEDAITAGPFVLSLGEARRLSSRALDSVIGGIPGLRALVPSSLLAWRETKWSSRGVMACDGCPTIAGHAIHERVIVRC